MISVYLSVYNLYFDTKNIPNTIAGYTEFIVKHRKELNTKASLPPARLPRYPNNLLQL
jgi:hypothetical protein